MAMALLNGPVACVLRLLQPKFRRLKKVKPKLKQWLKAGTRKLLVSGSG